MLAAAADAAGDKLAEASGTDVDRLLSQPAVAGTSAYRELTAALLSGWA